jgi:hypothetical protein
MDHGHPHADDTTDCYAIDAVTVAAVIGFIVAAAGTIVVPAGAIVDLMAA